jgi:putative FmdB family regulatory protein
MPLYDYDCAACGRRFEIVHGVHVDGPTSCPLCGKGPVRKAISAAAVHYKGSGWAKKERRTATGSSRTQAEGAETASATTAGATTEGGGADTGKPASGKPATGTPGAGTPGPSKAAETGATSKTD